jgi:MoaA/NifB/PqqE/SkfB family radical SAM enzyme
MRTESVLEEEPAPPGPEPTYTRVLNECITGTLRQVISVIRSEPALLKTVTRMLIFQRRAASRRKASAAEGVQVPPVVMISPTHRCNLACSGCYMRHLHQQPSREMTSSQFLTLVDECCQAGVSFVVLAGGEPLVRSSDILQIADRNPDLPIAVFTNALLIDDALAAEIGRRKNIVPIISIEGDKTQTDTRRSSGVYDAILRACTLLRAGGVFFGCSITTTRRNMDEVTSEAFISRMIQEGCRIFVYVAYVPFDEETGDQILTEEQHQRLNDLVATFSDQYPALALAFPGDEDRFGGCLSAGRGFIHISPAGDLEPCPAAPLSDTNCTHMPLREALRSPFLQTIRSHHTRLTEKGGGCALWTRREWAASLLASQPGLNPPTRE